MNERAAQRQQTVVIVGHMNPAIHHPGWYQLVGLLSEDETSAALQNALNSSPDLAQFRFGDIELLCLADRWQVTASSDVSGQRVLDLAKQTFARLYDTPVRAYGINNNFHIQSSHPDVAVRLGELSLMMALGLQELGKPSSATFTIRYKVSACMHQVAIAPSSKGTQFVSVMNNAHYEVPTTQGHFDLGALLDAAWSEASQRAELVVQAISDALG